MLESVIMGNEEGPAVLAPKLHISDMMKHARWTKAL